MTELCGLVVGSCRCNLSAGDHEAHVCVCGGSWREEGDRFEVVRWPGASEPVDPAAREALMAALYGSPQ